MLTAIIVMGGSWMIVHSLTSGNRTAAERARNAEVLAIAKSALIGYVAQQAAQSDENNPGRLPCPEAAGYFGDIAQEGIAAGTCTLPAVGRLPWRTLGLEKLVDASGEPLWYVVSSGWARSGGTLTINSNTLGQLTVDNQANAAVALIIAPGSPLSVQALSNCTARNQVRVTSASGTPIPPDYRDYLECDNASSPADATFITRRPGSAAYSDDTFRKSFNDQVLALSTAELLPVVEGAVARRILTSVVPQLQSVYASSTWGGTSTTPIFPFAAPFADPSTSTYKGTLNTLQGLLPLSASTCTTMTTGHCDDTFVAWDLSSIAVSKTGGTATSITVSCPTATTTSIVCDITYSRSLCFFCSINVSGVTLQAKARNVGMTLRTLNSAGVSGLSASTSVTTPLQTDGSALANYSSTATYNGGSGGVCGTLFDPDIPCTGTISGVTVPITIFQDHAFLNPSASDSWYWFFLNNWHQLTYYAVASSHSPSGATHNCVTASDCITVTSGTPASGVRATLALAGRTLTGATRPSGTLSNYLDGTENQNGDRAFEQQKVSKTFNDRFVTLSNY